MKNLAKIFVLLLACFPARAALAWGEEGHRLVGGIADRHLSAEARREVAWLLRDDRLSSGKLSHRRSLAEIAGWADEIKDSPRGKERGPWHYDDIPVCGLGNPARYCRKGKCASAQLARQLEILRDRSQSPHRRNEALKWVVHLAGDIHQPLHAADRRDRGGNEVKVSFFGQRDSQRGTLNLHAVWDTHLPRRLIAERGGDAAIVSNPAGAAETAAWQRGSITDWVDESHQVAKSIVYPALPGRFSCAIAVDGVLSIDGAYYAKAAPVIEQQLRKAGIRLAYLLNTALR